MPFIYQGKPFINSLLYKVHRYKNKPIPAKGLTLFTKAIHINFFKVFIVNYGNFYFIEKALTDFRPNLTY